MQPYFLPYPGYFRLFAATELFVIYDCVQFPRRGWVHRNQFASADGVLRWLTLPLRKAARSCTIRELQFASDARARMEAEIQRFPALSDANTACKNIRDALLQFDQSPVDYLERLLRMVCELLGLRCNVARSSSLGIGDAVRGQARIIEIARRFGAKHYVNAPGGRELYDRAAFEEAGLSLSFLSEYRGAAGSVLQRIYSDGVDAVAREVREQTTLTA